MASTLFTNLQIIDGSGAAPFAGQVLVEGNRIKAGARGGENLASDGAEVIDGQGATLMPGLVASPRSSARPLPSSAWTLSFATPSTPGKFRDRACARPVSS
jgi:hypothetical protein